jgi:thioredoxin-related protein
MKKLFIAGMLMFVSAMVGTAAETVKPGEWTQDIEAARAVAKEKGLPLLLNFTGSDWCGWCKLMDKNVFAKSEWENYAAQHLMLVTLDFPRNKSKVPEDYVERNQKLQEQFGVRGYPTYVLIDSDGETEIGRLGAGREKTPSSFIAEVEQLLQFSASSIAAFLETLTPEDKEAYQSMLDEIKVAENEMALTKDSIMQAREKMNTLHETILSLEEKAMAFRAEKEASPEE